MPTGPGYADIVIVSSYPADIDYWQAEKGLSVSLISLVRYLTDSHGPLP